MLILSRKVDESIIIGDNIEVSIIDIKGDQVKLGITAPKDVKVYRLEVYRSIQEENRNAARLKPDQIPLLDSMLEGQREEDLAPKDGETPNSDQGSDKDSL
ncbi:MAG: carbon storage regulator CsrA [Spirochaetales bacterium]|nr:carbon storage regulator CsrA [Spirochaetales bacterium]MCF7937570.1 carbon storage regulator CsrA [Spirochaetales bacterium]